MQRIKQCGGLIIGRPSGQEQAAFGSIQEYTLKNSGIKGYISHKRFGMYPHEVPDFSYFVQPDYEMTYERFKQYGFDKNADILYAIDVLECF